MLLASLWLFVIRPQRRRQVAQAQLRDSIAVGDEILTAGGVYGTVRVIEDDVVEVEIAPETVIKLDRRAVASVVQEPETEAEIEADADDPASRGES